MANTIDIRPLTKSDDRRAFSCGDAALDRYFRDYAGQNQFKNQLATNYVAVRGDIILGFITVSTATITRDDLPSTKTRKRLPNYPLPVLRLARLGVSTAAQGLGIGSALLKHGLSVALTIRDLTGCLGVLVDAKAQAIAFYERFGFVPLTALEGTVHGGTTPLFLPIDTIAKAARR